MKNQNTKNTFLRNDKNSILDNHKYNIKFEKNNDSFSLLNNFYNKDSKFIDTVVKLYLSKKYKQCIDLCLELLQKKIRHNKVYLVLGLSLCNENNKTDGIKYLKKGLMFYPKNLDLIFNIANELKKDNQENKAIKYYVKAIELDQEHISAYINLSELYNNISEYDEAINVCHKYLKQDRTSFKIYCNLGNAYFGLGNFAEALINYEKASKLNKKSGLLLHNKAICQIELKNFNNAKEIFEDGFKRNILNKTSMIDYGLCFFELGDLENALKIYEECEAIMPNKFEVFNNLGNLYSTLGKYEKAQECFEKAKLLCPDNNNLIFNIALNFFNKIMYDEAIKNCLNLIKINPNHYKSYNLLGLCYQKKRMIEEASGYFQKCIKINPNYYTAIYNYGTLCLENGALTKAFNLLQNAKDQGCKFPELNYYLSISKYNNFEGIQDNLKEFVGVFDNYSDPQVLSSYYLPILYNDNFNDKEIFEFHKKFDKSNQTLKISKNLNDKLRIGYVSADLTNHSVGYFIDPVLENHNKENYEIYLYFNSNKPDAKTKTIQSYNHQWRDIFGKSDNYVYDLIKRDKIDILVDLSGHTSGNRLGVFRKKPSFKQITWIGYPFTTGLKTIDYKFTDEITDPLGQTEKIHTEKLYRIPECFLCYKNENEIHINQSKPLETNNYVTFGSFNNILKISKKQIDIWIKILKLVPNSHLVLKSKHYSSKTVLDNVYKIFKNNDIELTRIKLLPMIPSVHGHLAMYNMIDISLDTSPFNGATTTFESLWMGVPVITLAGNKHLSRVGTTILQNLNLSELIAKDDDDYIHKIVKLCNNVDQLKYYQRNLRDLLKNSALCDGKKFTMKIEEAYTKIFNEN